MTPKERAAMQRALEALEEIAATRYPSNWCEALHDEITALREVLAGDNMTPTEQAEQEPVAAYKDAPRVIYLQTGCEDPEFCECSFNEWGDTTWCADKIHDTDIPYIREDYATPVRTKDLTDYEICELIKQVRFDGMTDRTFQFAHAVIAADREKNRG